MAHRKATVRSSPRARATVRAMVRAYLTKGQGKALGLCWALSEACENGSGSDPYDQVCQTLCRHRPRYNPVFDPYWWSFGPQGVTARKRVLRAICLEFGVRPPKGL